MRILGIDPGLQLTGYACIHADPDDASIRRHTLIEAGVFKLRPRDSLAHRLAELESDLAALIQRTRPDLACVEALFSHYAFPATAVTMGHARGVILLTLHRAGVPVVEFKPNAIKKHVTGNGHASKAQMQHAVQMLLALEQLPEPADVADAIAIALTGAARTPAHSPEA